MHYISDPEVVWIPSDEEVRLYSVKSGEFHALNHTAAEIWRELAEHRSVAAVTAELSRRYGAASSAQHAMIAQDIQEFVDRLLAQQLLVAADQDGADQDGADQDGADQDGTDA